jgi:hypothetical protein
LFFKYSSVSQAEGHKSGFLNRNLVDVPNSSNKLLFIIHLICRIHPSLTRFFSPRRCTKPNRVLAKRHPILISLFPANTTLCSLVLYCTLPTLPSPLQGLIVNLSFHLPRQFTQHLCGSKSARYHHIYLVSWTVHSFIPPRSFSTLHRLKTGHSVTLRHQSLTCKASPNM